LLSRGRHALGNPQSRPCQYGQAEPRVASAIGDKGHAFGLDRRCFYAVNRWVIEH